MINLMDVHFIVNQALLERHYFHLAMEDKKELVTLELEKYILGKIKELDSTIKFQGNEDIFSLVDTLSTLVDKTNHQNIDQLTHFIIGLMETMQCYSIMWEIDKELDDNPILDIRNGIINKLTTRYEEDQTAIFKFIYQIYY